MEQEMEATARLDMELSRTLEEMRGRVLVVEQDFRSMKGFENIENLEVRHFLGSQCNENHRDL